MNIDRAAYKANLLVIDDDPLNLRFLTGVLKDGGYKVRPAKSPNLAISAARQEAPDMILLDIVMPEKNGYEVCMELQADPLTCGIPVIFISALDEMPDKIRAFSAGGVDYITRPFEKQEILARIQTHLALRNMRRSLEQKNEQLRAEIAKTLKTQEKLKELEFIVSRSPAIAFLWRAEENRPVDFVSENIRMFGYAPDDFYTRRILYADIIHPDDLKRAVENSLRHTRENCEEYGQEYRIVTRTGDVRWVDDRTCIRRNTEGQPTHYQGIVTDITLRKQWEEELKEARKAAEKANRAKSEFLANMSHEIRTPMNAILGFSEILLSRPRDPQEKNWLKIIQSSGQTLLTLINDILDLSKIESGKMDLHYGPVSVASLLHEVRSIFLEKCEKKGIELKLRSDPEIPSRVITDNIRLRQILINLVDNAVKFTHEGYISIAAAGNCLYRFGNCGTGLFRLILEVADTGIGIPEDQQKIIFESFRQQDFQDSSRYGGTGLGLTISRRLAEIMGGHISVHSRKGEGSIFTVVLPNLKTAEGDDFETVDDRKKDTDTEFCPATIMIVDDIISSRQLIMTCLESPHIRFMEAANGREALELLAQSSETGHMLPQIILMDLRMPGMDGYETAKQIRCSERMKNIPLLAITASVMKEEEDSIRKFFDGYISKPISRAELFRELKRFLPVCDMPAEREEKGDEGEKCMNPEDYSDQLPDIINILNKEIFPKWEKIHEFFFVDDVSDFAWDLKNFAGRYKISFLMEYSEKLRECCRDIDVEKFDGLINEFPRLADRIRNW
ncbi:MAG: response regulator [Desulfococcaceae bacterium]